MSKVWICSDGSYSDYHVTALYSSQERAEAMTKANGWNEVEERELDPDDPPDYHPGWFHYYVCMYPDEGKEARAVIMGSEDRDERERGWWGRSYPFTSPDTWQFNCACWARDEDHAIKIAAERMAQIPRPKS